MERKDTQVKPIIIPQWEQEVYHDKENHKYACPRCYTYLSFVSKEKKYVCKNCGYEYRKPTKK